jgi:hypothetical protein
MTTTYRIKGWDTSGFEVSQNSRTRGPLKWVAIPTKHDGKGFRRLMRHKEGAALFGCWCLIVQVAAKCPTRGVLADDDGPLSSSDLHLKTGAPEKLMAEALKVLSEEVGWLEALDTGQKPPFDTLQQIVADPQQSVAACNKVLPTEQDVQDRTVRNETGHDSTPQAAELPDRADDIPLPKNLDESEPFKAAWREWLTYRRENRKSVRGLTLEKQLLQLSRWGPAKSCESIENTIRNGWTGLFDPDEKANGRRGNTQGRTDATRVQNATTDSDFASIPRVQG